MFVRLVNRVKQVIHTRVQVLRKQISIRTKPMNISLVRGSLGDLVRTKPQLVAENALLRQQLIVLNRSVKRPCLTNTDRSLLVLLASRVRAWKDALLIVQPDTLLRWHRQGFRWFWRRKSRAGSRAPRIPAETIALIQEMAVGNRLWGVKRIQGELLKLNIRVSKRTIGRYLRQVRPLRPRGQTWAMFLQNHARDLGLRLPATPRCPVPPVVRVLHHRAWLAAHCPCRGDTVANGCLGRAATARGDTVWHRATLSDPGQ